MIGNVRYLGPASPDLGRCDEWTDQAGCSQADPRLFDPVEKSVDGDAVTLRLRISTARSYCAACPVLDACLEDAIASKACGIRGGEMFNLGRVVRDPSLGGRRKKKAS